LLVSLEYSLSKNTQHVYFTGNFQQFEHTFFSFAEKKLGFAEKFP